VGALATLVKAMVDHLAKELQENTHISRQARDASNGRLSEALDRLAAESNRVMGLRFLIRERDDRIAYIVARLPQAEGLMREYRDQRTTRATEADEAAAERHAMGE
jgi:hypothetical protein